MMGISVVKFKKDGDAVWGVLHGEKIALLNDQPLTLKDLIKAQDHFLNTQNTSSSTFDIHKVEILAPVSSPLRIVCQGLNYASHRAESGLSDKSRGNVMFAKDESAITGPYSRVIRPKDCECLDYEAELGLVVKKDIDQPVTVTDSHLHEYVAGLVIANDLSPRDLQYRDDFAQWYKAKSFRTMLPLGPVLYLLDKEDFQHLQNLKIQLWVNDDLRQDANTSQLIFKPAETLTEISEFMNLSTGDLLLTGTPGGVVIKAPSKFLQGIATWLLTNDQKVNALRKKKSDYLQNGDVVRTRIFSEAGSIDLGTQLNLIGSNGF